MTTLDSIGIDLSAHSSVSADILLAGKLTKLYEYAKELEEEKIAEQKEKKNHAEWMFQIKAKQDAFQKSLPPGCDGK
jgi:16S rRNA C1402 (ribose-2'-O) methylase RsmI